MGLEAAKFYGFINQNTSLNIPYAVQEVMRENPKQILNRYKAVFEGPGTLKSKYKIRLHDNNVPVVSPPRKIPLALQDEVKKELQSMVKGGILEPVYGPSDWASPIIIVPKPNKKIRICMDPRSLNEFIIREKCWIPTPETVFAQLGKARYFTVLDATNAFHQIKLDHRSSLLCTITTPYGKFRYKRLPYGLSSAPEVFQQAVGDLLEGITGTVNYMDDILVYGATLPEHNERLNKVLKRIEQSGLKLSKDKVQLAVEKIHYLGHIISHQGIEADPNKTKDILNMPPPRTKTELQRFLGLVTYVAKYIPNLSERTAPLRLLLGKSCMWSWEPQGPEQKAFEELISLVTSSPILRHFNTEEEITLSVDASSYGIGAVLLQNNGPVAYASASLTPAQKRYSQIEKELLAVAYACEHYNYFVFGRTITIQTDHKPLLAIVKKPIEELTPRLQRLVLKLMRYSFNLVHIPGKKLVAADALSREPSKKTVVADYLKEVKIVCPIQLTSSKRMELMVKATRDDIELSTVAAYIDKGWPPKQKNLPSALKKYWEQRSTLHVNNGLLYKGNALFIPKILRLEFLKIIHGTHQGIGACRARAKESVYWPGMMRDIANGVTKCHICQSYGRSNTKESLTPHDIPTLPWQKIGVDFKTHGQLNYLVAIDYFSKFIVVNKIVDKTATSVITALKNIFAFNGIPAIIFSDNGPPFDSHVYNLFLDRYDIIKNTSSPRFPESNGMVERSIQNVKAMIHKACEEGKDLMLAVLNHNTTPKHNTKSSAEILMGRKLRTLLPLTQTQLNPLYDTTNHYNQLMKNRQEIAASRKGGRLTTLIKCQPVYSQRGIRRWEPAQVVQDLGNNSFNILTNEGRIVRRNRLHLKPRHDDRIMEDIIDHQEDIDQYIVPEADTPQTVLPKSEVNAPRAERPAGPLLPRVVTSRSGRVIKPPEILDL